MITEVVWGIILGLAAAYPLYRLLRTPPESTHSLFYDRNSRPWILIVRPEDQKDSPFVLWAKRLAFEYNIPFQEATPNKSPYPLPGHLSAIIAQGRYLWFTTNTFDRELYRRSLESMRLTWDSYLKTFRDRLSRGKLVFRPGLFATHGASFPHSYLSKAFFDPDEIQVDEEGNITTDFMGIPYHPYMEEGLRYFGVRILDYSGLAPFKEVIYVTKPIQREESI